MIEVPYSQFLTMVDDHQVTEVALDEDSRQIVFIAADEAGRTGYYKTGIWPDDGQRLLSQLRQQGRFRQELRGQTLQDVITLIMFSHVGWQQKVSVSRQPAGAAVEDMMRIQWLLLRPYLTEEGRAELAQLTTA